LGLARFASADFFAALRGFLSLPEFPRRSFARFGFDAFLRLAMIAPAGWCFLQRILSDERANGQRAKQPKATYQQNRGHAMPPTALLLVALTQLSRVI
jgi:hypothetical protein